jgi:hypothetical protein
LQCVGGRQLHKIVVSGWVELQLRLEHTGPIVCYCQTRTMTRDYSAPGYYWWWCLLWALNLLCDSPKIPLFVEYA